MNPFLVDVPVILRIWIRPDCQRKQFDVLKKARPSTLFLVSDGGRNKKEWEAIILNRKMFDDEIDWECDVYKYYFEENKGLYAVGRLVKNDIFSKIDRYISLEDDIIPDVSFFSFCAELLEKYKDDTRIELISGMNPLGKCDNVTSDYFFTRYVPNWGLATWPNRSNNSFCFKDDKYILDLLKCKTKKNKSLWKEIEGYAKNERHNGHVAGSEFWSIFNAYANNRVSIVPKYNLIKNIGCTEDSTHEDPLYLLPKSIRGLYYMEVYNIVSPLKHPQYVIVDEKNEKKIRRLTGYNTPFLNTCRKIERIFLLIFHRRWGRIFERLNRMKIGEN